MEKKMIKVLFVCLGNICRSPLAEGIFNKKVIQAGLSGYIQSDSAGTSGWHINEPPDVRTIETAGRHDIHLDHYGRKFIRRDLDDYDYIVAMDDENYNEVMSRKEGPENIRATVIKMLDFDKEQSGADVPDPYYGGKDGFEQVFSLLEESTGNLLNEIVRKYRIMK